MALDHMIDDGQSQAAVTLLTTGFIESLKRLKRPIPLIGWHALALIPDVDVDISLVLSQAHQDRWFAVGERIVDQICDRSAKRNRPYRR